MNLVPKKWLILGIMDLVITLYTYSIFSGSWYVLLFIVPTFLLLVIWLPIQRIINQINRILDKQNGKCYNCNLNILDKDTAVLEDNNHVYCPECHHKLYGHLYEERDGIWYKK